MWTAVPLQANLKVALDLASDCHRAYMMADDRIRRMMNQALFKRFLIDEDAVRGVPNEPFKTLLGPNVMGAIDRNDSDASAARADEATASERAPRDWGAEYIRHVRSRRPSPSRPRTNKPSARRHGVEGLKESTLVLLREHLSNFPKQIERLLAVWPVDGQVVPRERRVLVQPNRKLQPAEIDDLVAVYVAGADLTTVGRQFGMHRQTVKAHLERQGIAVRSELPSLDVSEIALAVKLYSQGFGLRPVGERLGVSANTVKRALLSQGVRLRPRGMPAPWQGRAPHGEAS